MLYNYCTLDLSAFYLDILKDRLYTSPPESVDRRSAQTVMHMILDAMVRLMAPILPFTAEEIWKFMPNRKNKEESIHLATMPVVKESWKDPGPDRQMGKDSGRSWRGDKSVGGRQDEQADRSFAGCRDYLVGG